MLWSKEETTILERNPNNHMTPPPTSEQEPGNSGKEKLPYNRKTSLVEPGSGRYSTVLQPFGG